MPTHHTTDTVFAKTWASLPKIEPKTFDVLDR